VGRIDQAPRLVALQGQPAGLDALLPRPGRIRLDNAGPLLAAIAGRRRHHDRVALCSQAAGERIAVAGA